MHTHKKHAEGYEWEETQEEEKMPPRSAPICLGRLFDGKETGRLNTEGLTSKKV